MPVYPGVTETFTVSPITPTEIAPGESVFLFGVPPSGAVPPAYDSNVVGESITSGQASIAFCRAPSSGSPPSVSFEITFSAAPGTFEIDIQEADTDSDENYIMPTASAYKVTAVNATTQSARVDLIPTGGKFMRVEAVTVTNAVKLIVKASCLS